MNLRAQHELKALDLEPVGIRPMVYYLSAPQREHSALTIWIWVARFDLFDPRTSSDMSFLKCSTRGLGHKVLRPEVLHVNKSP